MGSIYEIGTGTTARTYNIAALIGANILLLGVIFLTVSFVRRKDSMKKRCIVSVIIYALFVVMEIFCVII